MRLSMIRCAVAYGIVILVSLTAQSALAGSRNSAVPANKVDEIERRYKSCPSSSPVFPQYTCHSGFPS